MNTVAKRNVKTTTKNEEGAYEPFSFEDAPWEKFPGSDRFKRLGRFGGGSHIGVGIDVLEPGQYSNEFHYHSAEEEHIMIVRGSATLLLGSKSYVLKERDYCCFPAGQKLGHHLFNHTDASCTFMTIGESRREDICYYPKLGIMRVRATGEELPILNETQSESKE